MQNLLDKDQCMRRCLRRVCQTPQTLIGIGGLRIDSCYDSCSTAFHKAFPAPVCPFRTTTSDPTSTLQITVTTSTPGIFLPDYAEKQTANTITAAPSPTVVSTCTPRSICVDKINSCYIRYGGYVHHAPSDDPFIQCLYYPGEVGRLTIC